MSRNLLLAVGLLAALGLVAFLYTKGGSDTVYESELTLAAETEEPLAPSDGNGGALPELDPTPAEAGAETLAPRAEQGREEVAVYDPEQSFLLELQDPAGQPVAGADVWVIPSAGPKLRKRFNDNAQVDELMEEEGTPHSASEAGSLYLPRPDGGRTLVLATKGELWGKLSSPGKKDKQVLTLKRDYRLSVQVLDVAGAPVGGVPVLIEQVRPSWTSEETRQSTSGPEAIAVFPHVQTQLSFAYTHAEGPAWEQQDSTWRVSVEAMTKEPVAVELTPETLAQERIVLTLPATGEVEVTVLDEEWQPYSGNARASLEIVPEGEARRVSPFSHVRRRKIRRELRDGKARFDHVELGQEVGVEITRDNANLGTHAYGPGPRRAGETAPLEVRMGEDHPVVRLRALDAGGHPLTRVALFCQVNLRSQFLQTTHRPSPRTDAEGYFVIDLARDWTPGSTRTLVVTLKSGEEPHPTATVDLSRQLEIGLNEGGDVVLGQAATFARGRVETESGQPVAAAKLALRSKGSNSYGWDEHWNFDHKSKDDGTFVIEEALTSESFQLSANKDGFASQWLDFSPGDQNLVIVLRTEGRLEGSVLLDEGIPPDRISVRVDQRGDDDESLSWSDRQQTLGPGLSFAFGRLLPGKRTVTFSAKNQSDNLLTVEEVEIVSGETCRDPRLQQLDLRGTLFYHEIELVGSQPGERFNGNVRFGPPGAEELGQRAWLHEPVIKIICQEEAIDATIAVSGYRVETLSGFSGKTRIELRRGLTVTLVLTGEAEVPEPPVFVKAALVPADGEGQIDWTGDAFDERREIKSRVAQGGKMRVEWIVERRSSGSSVATSVRLEREQLVDVLDIDGDQRIEVDLTPEEMQEIIERLN